MGTKALKVYGQSGDFTTNTWNNGGISSYSLSSPVSITIGLFGNLYVVDMENNRILEY
jgi:hypothetical protein